MNQNLVPQLHLTSLSFRISTLTALEQPFPGHQRIFTEESTNASKLRLFHLEYRSTSPDRSSSKNYTRMRQLAKTADRIFQESSTGFRSTRQWNERRSALVEFHSHVV